MRTQHMALGTGPPATATFDKSPEAVSDARELTRGFVEGLSPAVDDLNAASIELVVSELVTNVVRHARGALCALRLHAQNDVITIAVTDADPRPPLQRAPDLEGGTGGFGWPMVQQLARAVGVTLDPTGKTIRAELAR
ncbi:ATP-binding protein [Streptomyces sp. NPDC046465]|uniref:ATP-binding protein n=1 Tax=Streptomyces sp. NPDC046465 TaxID=3155810 RepID=UPI0033E944ED